MIFGALSLLFGASYMRDRFVKNNMKGRQKKLTIFAGGLKCKESQIDLHNVLGAKPLRLQK